MAYVDQSHGKERTFAFIITAIIIVAVGYAFVTGLAYNVIKKAAKDLNVIDIQDKPPPPPEEPPPPKEQPKVEVPPIVAPPPLVQPPPSPVRIQAPPPPLVPIVRAPPAPSAPPAPPAPSQAVGAKPRGTPGEWVTSDDYPPSALRAEAQGRTGFKLDIDGSGKVTNCTVTSSSGNSELDATACRLLPRRARFSPAKDAAGNGMASQYSSAVVWQLPKD